MSRRVFNYRTPNNVAGIPICLVWAAACFFMPMIPDKHGQVHPAIPATILGIALIIGTIYATLWMINGRVEIDERFVRVYDYLGQQEVAARIDDVVPQPEDKGSQLRRARFMSPNGQIRFNSTIKNYIELRTLLESHGKSDDLPSLLGPPTYIPSDRVYRMRWGGNHRFSFLWLAIVGFMAWLPPHGIASILGPGVLSLPGIWLQLQGWNERIHLSRDGIVWYDWLGRERLRARLDQIWEDDFRDGNIQTSRHDYLKKIYTENGQIPAHSAMPRVNELRDEVHKLIRSRPRLDQPAPDAQPSHILNDPLRNW